MDEPNARSMHDHPVPRLGGLAVAAGTTVGWWLVDVQIAPIPILAMVLLVISFLDDLYGLPVIVRLSVHAVVVGVLIWYLNLEISNWIVLMVGLALIWMVNLYNFMDGSDGLAGGMACLGFGSYSFMSAQSGSWDLAMASGVVAAAALGFLMVNFHPAKLFLGDAGSIPLGFLAGALGLVGWHRGDWSLVFPVLVFSPFIADASVTLIKRLVRSELVWLPHREHYYQRLLLMGLGHRGVAILAYVMMIAAAGLAMLSQALPGLSWLVVMVWFALIVLGMTQVDRAWRLRSSEDV